MKISVVIVSYKVKDMLRKCLESIRRSQGDLALEIFVVDNASGDGTVEMVKNDFPEAKLIASQENLGFAKANNLALKQAQGEYVLLLNPDTEVNAETFANSLEFFQRHPEAGVVGPKMFYGNGELQPSVRRLPKLWPIVLMLLKAPKVFPHLKSIDNYLATDFDYAREQAAEQIMGAYMFMPRATLDKIGLLDERYFIWFEEVDFCRRVWQAGLQVWYSPSISIIHHGGKSFAQQAFVTKQQVFFTSAAKYFLKYGLSKAALPKN